MRRIFTLALPTLLLSASLAQAQSYYPPARSRLAPQVGMLSRSDSSTAGMLSRSDSSTADVPGAPQVLVRSWYERYLRRQPDAGASSRVLSLRTGHSPEDVVSSILASEEYFTAAGRSNPGYVRQLYLDLLGWAPLPAEITYWAGRLRYESRKDIAYRMLISHPQNWSGMKAPPPSYDPGFYPDPASPTFRDPSGPYFHSPYFYNYEKSRAIRAFPLDAQG